jgi:transitional endoplasmic reticulum ATPase
MNDVDQIIKILRQTLESTPDNNEARCVLATLLSNKKLFTEATENFEMVLKKEPENKEALFGMGKCSYYLKDLSDTRIFLGKLLKLTENNHPEANLLMAKTYLELNDLSNARSYYTAAVNLDPGLADDELRNKIYGKVDTTKKTDFKEILDNESVRIYAEGFREEEDLDDDEDIEIQPATNFNMVGGLDKLKETIRQKIIYPFKNPDIYKAYGKKAGGGILLYGPPGCGKTFISRATAGECDATFIPIAISDVLDMWLGESEKKLHNIFEVARNRRPSIIFIDEIDALGGSRQSFSSTSTKMLVNQLLSEMDGLDSSNDKILIIGATNSPWFVDSALRRPGRFDRIIFVAPPDLSARIEILQLLSTEMKIEKFNFKNLALKTAGFSGADLKALVELATEGVINEAMKTGNLRDINEKDFLKVLKEVKPSTKEWFSTAKNYATYANQAGLYDEVLEYIKTNKF